MILDLAVLEALILAQRAGTEAQRKILESQGADKTGPLFFLLAAQEALQESLLLQLDLLEATPEPRPEPIPEPAPCTHENRVKAGAMGSPMRWRCPDCQATGGSEE